MKYLDKKHKKLKVKADFGGGVEVLDLDAILGNPKLKEAPKRDFKENKEENHEK
jgi:hypothetical protein